MKPFTWSFLVQLFLLHLSLPPSLSLAIPIRLHLYRTSSASSDRHRLSSFSIHPLPSFSLQYSFCRTTAAQYSTEGLCVHRFSNPTLLFPGYARNSSELRTKERGGGRREQLGDEWESKCLTPMRVRRKGRG